MDWKEFKLMFGTDTTTNFDLIRWSKYLKLKPFQYAMRDEIKDLPQYGYFITNIHTSNERGIHHSAIYSDSKKVYYFDSFALPPTVEIIQKFNHTDNRICGDSEEQIQTFEKKYCGQMALYFLHRIDKGDTFEEVLEQLK